MTPRLTFRPAARVEILDARRWYEGQLTGLGRAFIAELEATLAFVRLHPRMYVAVVPDGAVRRALLHRFPYAIVYEILPVGDLVVLACKHVRQEDVDWQASRPDV